MKRVLMRNSASFSNWTQSGAAMVETIVALPVLLLLTLGGMQWAQVYEAKSTLNYAAFMAARAGAVNGAAIGPMEEALVQGMVPLYSPEKNAAGFEQKRILVQDELARFSRIKILNPTIEAFQDFGVAPSYQEIPNEQLHMLNTNIGPQSGVNIQDANLLKIEVMYGYQLKIPYISNAIVSLIKLRSTDPLKKELLSKNRLPILATAMVRMQSRPVLNDKVVSKVQVEKALQRALNP